MSDKKKKVTAVVAVATAMALLLGGTFAWQSISQTALNEKEATINPGGRLHDDFNGSNKDVYVENFADEPIFARVRLDEYFEITMNKNTPAETTEVITTGASKDDTSSYLTHYFDQTNLTDEYWDWATGGSTKYMPTFNKNKDSLKADINGTYENDYDDYVEYIDGEELTADATYDNDSNAVEDDGVVKVEETHYATETGTANLISMEEWLALEDDTDNYWVYDTDGWVYWSSPIASNTATGLLLDEIGLTKIMDDSYYYAINVVGQFITADDLGKDDNTGFYADGETVSDNALELLERIGVTVPQDDVDEPWTPSPLEVGVSGTPSWYLEGTANTVIQLTASAMYNDVAVDDSVLANVTWELSNNSSDTTVLSETVGKTTTLTIYNQETSDLLVSATLNYQGETEESVFVISNGPSIGSLVTYRENNFPVGFSGGYTVGAKNVYHTLFFEEYKGDILKYDINDAYTGQAKEILDKKISYTLAEEYEGITLEQSDATITVTVPENYSSNIVINWNVENYTSGSFELRPEVTDYSVNWARHGDYGGQVTTSIDGENVNVTYNATTISWTGIQHVISAYHNDEPLSDVLNRIKITEVALENGNSNTVTYTSGTKRAFETSIDYGTFDYTYFYDSTQSSEEGYENCVAKINTETGTVIVNDWNLTEGNTFTIKYDLQLDINGIVKTFHVAINVIPSAEGNS